MLHGTIMVNGALVASWSAQRITNTEESVPRDPQQWNTYRCRVAPKPRLDAFSNDLAVEFDLEHRYSDGAARLAAEVLASYDNWSRTTDGAS
jgi:hypothetical protein